MRIFFEKSSIFRENGENKVLGARIIFEGIGYQWCLHNEWKEKLTEIISQRFLTLIFILENCYTDTNLSKPIFQLKNSWQNFPIYHRNFSHKFSDLKCFIPIFQLWIIFLQIPIFRLNNFYQFSDSHFFTVPKIFPPIFRLKIFHRWVVLQKLPQLSNTHFSQVLISWKKIFFMVL